MMRLARGLALLSPALLAACVTSRVAPFPPAEEGHATVTAQVLSETGSGYMAEKGQVAVYGKIAGTRVGGYFGVVGLGIGQAVDFARNRAYLQGREDAIKIRFDALVADRLRAAGIKVTLPASASASVLFEPRADLAVDDDGTTALACHLEARYGDWRGRAPPEPQRRYVLPYPERRPLFGAARGWLEDDARPLREATATCFDWLARVAAADWRGAFERARPVSWKPPGADEPRQAQLLYESPEFAVIAGGSSDAPIRSHLTVVERSAIQR